MGLFNGLFGKNKVGLEVGKDYYLLNRNEVREGNLGILRDSLNLISKTTNPDTYFPRYKMAGNEACMYKHTQQIIWNGMNSVQIERMLRDQQSKDKLHMEFIDRLFNVGCEDRMTYMLYEYGGYMSTKVQNYFVKRLNGKIYHFCKVRFDNTGNKTYTYVTKDKSITIGDTVTIPTGNEFVPESKVMQVVDVFDASLEHLGFPIDRLRCVERKLKSIVCPHCGAPIEVDTDKKLGKCTKCSSEFYFI